MNIIIYNPNSFGGNFEYSKKIAQAYINHDQVRSCWVIYPGNAQIKENFKFSKILLPDRIPTSIKLFSKVYFIFRSIINPIIFFFLLAMRKKSYVIFNDYDQISAPIWSPLLISLKKRHVFSAILHDPDRDYFLPSLKLSRKTMTQVMKVMHIGFFHEALPQKPYYSLNQLKLKSIPHGIYSLPESDLNLDKELKLTIKDKRCFSIIGNIRDEKNYDLVIQAVAETGGILIIAGNRASSDVPVEHYKRIQQETNCDIIWLERYLDEKELASVIKASETIVLYYKVSFTSQSGILNLVAPYKKNVIISESPSGLTKLAKEFKLGQVIEPDNLQALVNAMRSSIGTSDEGWDNYLEYASWKNHSDIVISSLLNEA